MTRWKPFAPRIVLVLSATALLVILAGCGSSGSGDQRTLTQSSGSMEPTIGIGDTFTVDLGAYEEADPRLNDIVVAYGPRGAAGKGPPCGDPRAGAAGKSGAACDKPTPERSDGKYLKRIVAGPGDTVSIRNGHTVVNGVEAREDFIKPCGSGPACDLPKPITIPPDHWFLLGDNRGASDDSRYWGPIPTSWILGRVEQ